MSPPVFETLCTRCRQYVYINETYIICWFAIAYLLELVPLDDGSSPWWTRAPVSWACSTWCSVRSKSHRCVPRRNAVFATSSWLDQELRLIGIGDAPFEPLKPAFISKMNCSSQAVVCTGSKQWSLVTETYRLSVGNWKTEWLSSLKHSSAILQRITSRSNNV